MQQEENKNARPRKKSWVERNIWLVATAIAIFLIRMYISMMPG